MAKEENKPVKKISPIPHKEKVAIKGDFLDVFKVVKKHKEQKAKNTPKR